MLNEEGFHLITITTNPARKLGSAPAFHSEEIEALRIPRYDQSNAAGQWLSQHMIPVLPDPRVSSLSLNILLLLHGGRELPCPWYLIGLSSVQRKSVKMLGLTDAHSS